MQLKRQSVGERTMQPNDPAVGSRAREEWLLRAVAGIDPWIRACSDETTVYEPPEKFQVAFSLPKGNPRKIVGQAWDPAHTDDGVWHIMVSPTHSDPLEIIGTLLHERVHTVVGIEAGHKRPFKRLCDLLGMEGKPTHAHIGPEGELHDKALALIEELGPLPHSALDLSKGRKKKTRPPAGGWIKLVSKTDRSYILRISPKAIELGMPTDPWGEELERA